MNTNIYIKSESGIFTKLVKGFCITTFPVVTAICVGPSFIKNTYNVIQSYNKCQEARKNIVGQELGLVKYVSQRSSGNGNI